MSRLPFLPLLVAACSLGGIHGAHAGNIVVDLYVDRQENTAFLQAQDESGFDGFVYGMVRQPGGPIAVAPANETLMGVWKGNRTIHSDTEERTRELFFEDLQFAPALLVVDVTNEGLRSARVTSAYLEVARSNIDLQPYLTPWGSGGNIYCSPEEPPFEANIGFRNWGWGKAESAKAQFSFTNESGGQGDAVHEEPIGDIAHVAEFSILNALDRSGVDIERLKSERFPCPSLDQTETCIKALANQGLFGDLADILFSQGFLVTVRTLGVLNYTWRDSQGAAHQRGAPFSVDVVILEFNRTGPECGGAGPIERNYNTVRLLLDGADYRIPLGFSGQLKPKQNRRFALALVADKSSQHNFKVVLELADGTTAASPEIDLLYFMPRFGPTN